MEKWFLLSRRVWLRLSAAIFGVLLALSTFTPETADAIVAPLCALIGPSCVPDILRPKIMALAALSAVLLKLWRMLFPDDARLTALPRRAGPLLVALAALGLGGCASPVSVTAPACSITAELRTGERISCTAEGVTVERASIAETVKASGGLLGGALRTLLGAP